MVLALNEQPRPMGRPRGRGGPKQAEPRPLQVVPPPKIAIEPGEAQDLDLELYEKLVQASPVKDEATKQTLALVVCTLLQQAEAIRPRIRTGTATGEEHRAMSGICSNIRRTLETLGTTSTEEKDLDL